MSFRDLGGHLSCVVGIGPQAWDALNPDARPAELHPFPVLSGARHTAVSTPGDLLFHIRAEREDLCFEFERLLLDSLGDAVTVVDEVRGFRYFDTRDLLGFVDGTANPVGDDVLTSAVIDGDDDPVFAGGSFVVVQKYLHDVAAWNTLTTEQQEAIIGRSKLDNVERDSDAEPYPSHKSLATITDETGREFDILRDNMPFGRPGQGEFGTYFIGYAARLWVVERMLERMFVGDEQGRYDKILDFSTAVTGTTFFVPPLEMLESLGEIDDSGEADDEATSVDITPSSTGTPTTTTGSDGSLGLGSLRRPTPASSSERTS
ncbi:Dyp-type peroxidase [Frondihabitans sp. PAMC 28766]|uniref:Dyp-type peroxidase n=1 Tax=Frondihabitans sp. PAMC 28766 TaxID=1795630 RepID=UPI000A84C750